MTVLLQGRQLVSHVAAPKTEKPLEFRFTAVQTNQKMVRGLIKAHTRKSAQDQLLLRYAHLLALEEVAEQQTVRQLLSSHQNRSTALPVYTKSIAVMFDAGLPLVNIFETVAQGEDEYLNQVMLDVADSLKRGQTLSNSLARWNAVFDKTYVGMIYAAEQSGRLHKTFGRLAELLEKRWRIEKRVKSALAYPAFISVVALAIFWVLVAFVIPQIVPSFNSVGAELPWITKVLLQVGSLSTSVPVMLGGLMSVVGCVVMAYRVVVKGDKFPQLALHIDQMKFSLPVFGELFRLAALSRTLSTMAAMIDSGLSLSKVLSIGGKVSGSPLYEAHFQAARASVEDGESLADAFASTRAFPPLVVGVTRLGEEAGKLPFLMTKIASLYEEDLDLKVASLASLIEPLIMAVLGVVIGFIVLGTFMPMINLIHQF
jgi:type IV pilus assembly protein PilC